MTWSPVPSFLKKIKSDFSAATLSSYLIDDTYYFYFRHLPPTDSQH